MTLTLHYVYEAGEMLFEVRHTYYLKPYSGIFIIFVFIRVLWLNNVRVKYKASFYFIVNGVE